MKILVTGVDGFLGKKIFSTLSKKYEMFGISRNRESENIFLLDILDNERLERVVAQIKPSVIVHTAALVDVERCEKDRELAYAMNVTCTEHIAELCKKYKIKLIYFSTDYVFSGKQETYMTESKKDPINYYGETKSIGEEKIKSSLSDFAIMRPTILYGFNEMTDKKNFVLNLVSKLKKGERVVLDNKRIKYPLLIDDVARAIEKTISGNLVGIFHLSGANGVTKYEWGLKVAEVFGLDKNIAGKDLNEPYRPQKITFGSGDSIIKVLNLESGLKIVKKQIELEKWK